MHQSCFTLLVLGLAIATQADNSPTHHESQDGYATPSRDEWQEDMIPGLSHGHATNGNQVREHFWGGGDTTTNACLVDRSSAWKGWDCNSNTCYKYRTGKWSEDMRKCCTGSSSYDCTSDWCLQKEWGGSYTCGRMKNYWCGNSAYKSIAQRCCPDKCATYKPSPPTPTCPSSCTPGTSCPPQQCRIAGGCQRCKTQRFHG